MIVEGRAIFQQIAEHVEDSIIDGTLAEDDQAPSTNELAAFYRINPATAAKGIALLVDKGILTKRRGIGMFVTPGARDRVLAERESAFADAFVEPLLAEALKLGLSVNGVIDLIRARSERAEHPATQEGVAR
ncbi:Transcriptional regulator, GntR family OS=Tsukamurella paurometabola (strain ATCC 8368 / DSM/ CCUG 35730 / CIP 100753 / JCM 10117 / KCTC 9821 / NBRC 16120/ NCIMB 702349 / NCTC 13040) OX=521096 GN=Tpau_1337 PE=4 SV=1 [Tsukamurella paurometabola]|uniref:Transcriptional regulator, GntR family n=1 Tax=Tsukamurella paurometabola (strain ATCC 8368 / DSM 20162 / CCUG 35730 / CIP 100753 / JCM 10117 / KCTC 9821 / NBRC 16120 / NCIMB 702349 / NCTC 13040) TaxID=521096 RepID=D5UWU4_TSUPD|nr:GntR family transcriptional regulator [Tsukamurella paurometabola]ADG77966.1 transcriptional regulator, GntR family [Tsukamurella paurometabola DSM 20162]SUP29556.1 phosphonate metabolism transcriptional regulator PhnF [Tsukamurella paurometabola]